ncbi:MAG TPA: ATP-binding protein [Oculatellaceae cyanobacterium]
MTKATRAINLLPLLKRSPLKNRLLAPLYTSFIFLVLLAIAQTYLNILLERYYQQTADQVTRSLSVEQETERLLSAVIEEQTSVRGYLLTQDITFLEPYRTKARRSFYSSQKHLFKLVQENPLQLQKLLKVQIIYNNWQNLFVHKVLNGTASRTTLPGKILFDPMRLQAAKLLEYEEKILSQRQQQLSELNQLKTVLNISNLVIIIAGIGWNLWLLRRTVELPLWRLTKVGASWRKGNLEVRLDYSSPDEIGRLAEVLDGMAREIRDRQVANQMRSQQLEDMISALSHDLRTPLLATKKTLRPMINGAFGEVSDIWKEILEEFDQSNDNLLKLVNTLLDVSRYEAGGSKNLNWEPLDWEKIFTQAINQIDPNHQRPCPLTFKIAPSLPIIYGDAIEIQRVIQNLLDNAVRVSEPHQPITLEVSLLSKAVKVEVCDRGCGISPQEKEKLFHRFIQGRGRRGGAGLGLYLSRQIIAAHGGMIDVESKLGEGSTFWFTLPIAQEESSE